MLAYADVCGMHITHNMQTHVATTLSEEIQMKGRTARQGEKGSWAMVLRKKELSQTYAITDEELSAAMSAAATDAARKAVWALIDGKRMGINVKQLQELIAFVASNERTHADALAFVAALLKRDKDAVRLYLERRNKPQRSGAMAGKARILVLMDATGSMGNVLSAAKDAVSDMFSRAGSIIEEHLGKGSEKFEMQFAVFRNYSSGPPALLQYSAWKSNPEELRDFLQKTTASGGQGNEAIEIGLWHANQQADVRRVILIGDAPGNTDKETADRRAGFGSARWNNTSYETPTTVSAEVRKLAEKKIPIDCFYVLDRCKQAFESYAQATEGKAFLLDMSLTALGRSRELLIGENPLKKNLCPLYGACTCSADCFEDYRAHHDYYFAICRG
jgi:hypothetical protein